MVDKIKIYLMYCYFQQSQCLNIKKHAVHNIHILAWGPRATALCTHAFRRHWVYTTQPHLWCNS